MCRIKLRNALESGDAQVAMQVLEQMPDMASEADAKGRLPLHHAVSYAAPSPLDSVVTRLCQLHAPGARQPDPKNEDHLPLHVALLSGHADIVLLERTRAKR